MALVQNEFAGLSDATFELPAPEARRGQQEVRRGGAAKLLDFAFKAQDKDYLSRIVDRDK
jgi:hypothetical protein